MPIDLPAKFLVVWLSAKAVETFLGFLDPTAVRGMASCLAESADSGEAR